MGLCVSGDKGGPGRFEGTHDRSTRRRGKPTARSSTIPLDSIETVGEHTRSKSTSASERIGIDRTSRSGVAEDQEKKRERGSSGGANIDPHRMRIQICSLFNSVPNGSEPFGGEPWSCCCSPPHRPRNGSHSARAHRKRCSSVGKVFAVWPLLRELFCAKPRQLGVERRWARTVLHRWGERTSHPTVLHPFPHQLTAKPSLHSFPAPVRRVLQTLFALSSRAPSAGAALAPWHPRRGAGPMAEVVSARSAARTRSRVGTLVLILFAIGCWR